MRDVHYGLAVLLTRELMHVTKLASIRLVTQSQLSQGPSGGL